MGARAHRPGATLSRRAGLGLVTAVTAVGLLADQVTKAWAVAALPAGVRRPFVGELLQLHLVRNSGAAFSLGAGSTWIFSVLAIVALSVVLLWVGPTVRRRWWGVGIGLFGAGIAGNLVDRLVRPPGVLRGEVVDFLELPHWPIFNVADMCITTAAVLIVGLSFFAAHGHDGRPRKAEREPDAAA